MYDITSKLTTNPGEIIIFNKDTYSISVNVRNDKYYDRVREIVYDLHTVFGGEILVKEYKRWGFYECSQIELHNIDEDTFKIHNLLPQEAYL